MQEPARSKGNFIHALTSCGLLHLLTHIFNLYWYNFELFIPEHSILLLKHCPVPVNQNKLSTKTLGNRPLRFP